MLKQIDTLNKVYKNEISDDIDECFSTLCSYFKENIKIMADNFKPNKTKIYLNEFKNLRKMNIDSIKTSTFRQLDYDKDKKIEDVLSQNRVFQENFLPVHSSLKNKENKDPFRALSQSCLSTLNIKTLLNKIISNERTGAGAVTNSQNNGQSNQSTIETWSTCNSVGTLLKENIENQEEVLKIFSNNQQNSKIFKLPSLEQKWKNHPLLLKNKGHRSRSLDCNYYDISKVTHLEKKEYENYSKISKITKKEENYRSLSPKTPKTNNNEKVRIEENFNSNINTNSSVSAGVKKSYINDGKIKKQKKNNVIINRNTNIEEKKDEDLIFETQVEENQVISPDPDPDSANLN
jgi:hypothetical protein